MSILCVVITIMNQLCQLLALLKWSVRVSINLDWLPLLKPSWLNQSSLVIIIAFNENDFIWHLYDQSTFSVFILLSLGDGVNIHYSHLINQKTEAGKILTLPMIVEYGFT